MNQAWKSDPRLKDMDPKKLTLLTRFAEDLEKAPKDQKLSVFLSLNRAAAEADLHFSSAETELLLAILTEGMTPKERSQVQLIKSLADRMSGQRPKR